MRSLHPNLASILLVAIAMAVFVPDSLAATYYGNNTWTLFRLPWQHGNSFGLTQGYNTQQSGGNHWGFNLNSVDVSMPWRTPVLAVADGLSCQLTAAGSGLGTHVVLRTLPPSGSGRAYPDLFFYGHLNDSWLPDCSINTTYVFQGQIAGWSGDTGAPGQYHLHTSLHNPGHNCYCDPGAPEPPSKSWPFPPLSGIDFSPFASVDVCSGCSPTEFFVSDNVMPGDSNAKPQPTFYPAIFNRWANMGGSGYIGVPWNAGSGPGVHAWGNGVIQDFLMPPGMYGHNALMQASGSPNAYWMIGTFWTTYISMNGPFSFLGYPTSDPFAWFSPHVRQNFQGGCMITLADWSVQAYSTACTPPNHSRFHVVGGAEQWAMDGSVKRWIPDQPTADCWLPFIDGLPSGYETGIPSGSNLQGREGCTWPQSAPPQCSRIHGNGGAEQWAIKNGQKRWIPDQPTADLWQPFIDFLYLPYVTSIPEGAPLQHLEGC